MSWRWLERFKVDRGADRVFFALRPDQQEVMRRMGGLGHTHPSAVLMQRIRKVYGYIEMEKRSRSRSPVLGRGNTQWDDSHSRYDYGTKRWADPHVSLAEALEGLSEYANDYTNSWGAAEHTWTEAAVAEPVASVSSPTMIVIDSEDPLHVEEVGRGRPNKPIPPWRSASRAQVVAAEHSREEPIQQKHFFRSTWSVASWSFISSRVPAKEALAIRSVLFSKHTTAIHPGRQ